MQCAAAWPAAGTTSVRQTRTSSQQNSHFNTGHFVTHTFCNKSNAVAFIFASTLVILVISFNVKIQVLIRSIILLHALVDMFSFLLYGM